MFECNICSKQFESERAMAGHKSSHSRIGQKRTQKSRIPKVEVSCLHCGKTTAVSASKAGTFCSLDCTYANRKLTTEQEKRKQWEQDELGHRLYVRKFLTEEKGYACAECGISEWNGKPITLWVDHIDGNATNCARTNYRLVCPNCDSQSPTFGAKNYGKGRKSRGLPQYG